MNWKVGKKIFETENEAKQFAKDLMTLGACGGWSPTDEPATHRYTGNAWRIGRTEKI